MGRHASLEYTVRNTFVDIPKPTEEFQFGRGTLDRAYSADQAGQAEQGSPSKDKSPDVSYLAAATPSPFLHPAQDPTQIMPMMPLPANGYIDDGSMPIAFGDFGVDFDLNADGSGNYDTGEQQNFAGAMVYDPNTGMYMPYDWSNMAMQFAPDGTMCYPMMGVVPVEAAVDEFGNVINCAMPNGEHGEQMMGVAGQEGGMAAECLQDGSIAFGEVGVINDGIGMDGNSQLMMTENAENLNWNSMDMHGNQGRQDGERGGRKSRNRDRAERAGRGSEIVNVSNANLNVDGEGPINYTTVMFRNIPNKYTREMLVEQLKQDLKGHFDFVYLPIDFKNQCNVGYAFINFRSVEACATFVNNFNGVEVRKCLPGLNSRKVTEVTPARVQGFDENVQRLRNSPVMRELIQHREWMPLIFNEDGVQVEFPAPERVLEPIKPRRRAREEFIN